MAIDRYFHQKMGFLKIIDKTWLLVMLDMPSIVDLNMKGQASPLYKYIHPLMLLLVQGSIFS